MTSVTGDNTTTLLNNTGVHSGGARVARLADHRPQQANPLTAPVDDFAVAGIAPRPLELETPPPASGTGIGQSKWLREPASRPAQTQSEAKPQTAARSGEAQQSFMPNDQRLLAEMAVEDATRYFQHLDTAFADVDAHRGVMHGPMNWPQPDTPAGQERVEGLIVKLFKPKERPESAYTTLILYMPAPNDPKRLDKVAGFAQAASRSLRAMVEQGALPLATSTIVYQSLARHAAAGSAPKEMQAITRMFERKRLEVVSI